MEKKITVPPSAVARTAPCSQPGTSTQTTVTSTCSPTAAPTATGLRASAMTTSSAIPATRTASASASVGTSATSRPAPARRAATRDSEPDLPPPPSTHAVAGRPRSRFLRRTIRSVSAGAPQTSSTDRARFSGRSGGSTAAIERPNRIAVPRQGTCSPAPSQSARPSVMVSGVRLSETSVATRSPARRPSVDSGPTSRTVPISMPPEPVTGFCILPRSATMASTAARSSAAVGWVSRSWR